MDVIIAGGGLTGLSCAFELQKFGIKSTIIDFRQEIGSPTRSPGLIRDIDYWNNWRKTFNLDSNCDFIENDNGFSGIRREWLEKNLAIELGKKGINILMKRKIDHLLIENKKINLITNEKSKRSCKTFTCDFVVDALGNKSQNSTWSCNPQIILENLLSTNSSLISIPKPPTLVTWNGGLTLNVNTKKQFQKQSIDNIVFERGDGFFECWSKTYNFSDTTWLELMKGEHPPSPSEFSVDISIKKGTELALMLQKRISSI